MCGGPVSRATSNFTVIFLFSAFSCTRLIGDFSSEKVASGVVATAVAAVVVWLESFVMITSSLASPDPDDVQEADVAAAAVATVASCIACNGDSHDDGEAFS